MCESTDVDPSLQSSWRLLWEKKTAGKWWGDRKIWGVCEGFCLTCFAAIEIPNWMVGNPLVQLLLQFNVWHFCLKLRIFCWPVAGDSKNVRLERVTPAERCNLASCSTCVHSWPKTTSTKERKSPVQRCGNVVIDVSGADLSSRCWATGAQPFALAQRRSVSKFSAEKWLAPWHTNSNAKAQLCRRQLCDATCSLFKRLKVGAGDWCAGGAMCRQLRHFLPDWV